MRKNLPPWSPPAERTEKLQHWALTGGGVALFCGAKWTWANIPPPTRRLVSARGQQKGGTESRRGHQGGGRRGAAHGSGGWSWLGGEKRFSNNTEVGFGNLTFNE